MKEKLATIYRPIFHLQIPVGVSNC